jgi:hypothetical protein
MRVAMPALANGDALGARASSALSCTAALTVRDCKTQTKLGVNTLCPSSLINYKYNHNLLFIFSNKTRLTCDHVPFLGFAVFVFRTN